MLPVTKEQSGVAARVDQLGAGLLLDRADASSIRNAIKTVLADNTYKRHADQIAAEFRRCSGAKGAADKILEVCESAELQG